jgi:hypothetical protein
MTTQHIAVTVADAGPDIWDAGVAFGSAIFGAIAGAIPAYLLARRGSKEVLDRDRQARREAERALGLAVHVKLGAIVNSLLVVQRHIQEALANPPGPGAELWQTVQPIVGFDGEERLTFEASEMAVFLSAERGDFAEALLLLARRHAVLGETLRVHSAKRQKLRDDMPPPVSLEGTRGSTVLTAEEMRRVRPQMVELSDLLDQMIEGLTADVDLALELARDFGPILRGYFEDPAFPAFVVPDDRAELLAVRRYGQPKAATARAPEEP